MLARNGGAGAPHRGDGDHHAPEHREEPEDSDDDAPDAAEHDSDDESADAGEQEEDPVDEVAIAQRAVTGRRADDVGVVVQEMALHLVEQTLLLFGEWHVVPLGYGALHLTRGGALGLATGALVALRMLGVVPPPSPVIDAVAARLESFLEAMRREASDYGPDAAALLEVGAGTLVGGKRLRARFAHAGWRSIARFHGRDAAETDAVWGVCAALEIFQSAALVHDDLIDNSDTRRGRPAAHRALEAAHRDAGWSGDAEAFGRAGAVLLGDLLISWSDDLLEQALDGHPRARAVRAEYARMRRDVTVGQFLDVAEESAWSVNPDDTHAERALRVVSLKSARYSIEQPLILGAALAGADDEQLAALRAFGHPVGMAFQLRDDVLGVFGDASVTGKPAGDDLREGKRTVLIALTREALDAPARTVLDELLGDPGLTPEQIGFLQTAIADSGALEHAERMIAEHAQTADRALRGAPLDNAAVGELRELARAATVRSA